MRGKKKYEDERSSDWEAKEGRIRRTEKSGGKVKEKLLILKLKCIAVPRYIGSPSKMILPGACNRCRLSVP